MPLDKLNAALIAAIQNGRYPGIYQSGGRIDR